jgi:Fe-S-cluster-containing hydrogenase component 2
MADKPKVEEKKTEEDAQGISRRELLVKGGIGVTGLVVGGAVGYGVIPRPAQPSSPLPEYWIGRNIADQSCMGCRLCEVACSQIKENKIQPSIARVQVPQYFPGVEFPVLCYQCGDDAKCIEACPVQALSLDTSKKLNTIKIDTTKCLRTAKDGDCTLCADKCPGGAVTFHPTSKAPLICDLCDGDPACVKACYSATLTPKGVKMAAVAPADIAVALANQYKIPPPPPKTSHNAPKVVMERNDDLYGDTV